MARIGAILPAPDEPERWRITFTEDASCLVEDVWQGWQNPVHYGTFAELRLDARALRFSKPGSIGRYNAETAGHPATPPLPRQADVVPLSISSAKMSVAAFYGVRPETIEITIRG